MDIPEEIEKDFFYPVCNKEEIDRIFNVANGADYLLKLRAETIVDNMRLFRVYRNKALANPNDWSLEKSFDTCHYHSFLNRLPDHVKKKCNHVVFGNMFSNDPDGMIFATDYGPIISISESLIFFLKFAHLALLNFKSEVPYYVRHNALRIAMRVMLKTETMDFYMDPRGIVPSDVGKAIHTPIPLQLEFIAGHEFAHYILDHIASGVISNRPIYHAISSRDVDYKPAPVFLKSQQQELDADVQAVLLVKKDPRHMMELLDAALLWFVCLDLYESVADALYPTNPWKLSHPSARDRFEHLLTNIPKNDGYNESSWSAVIKTIDAWKSVLTEDVPLNVDKYEMYGSGYLDKPNSKWRGRELIDRVDYY